MTINALMICGSLRKGSFNRALMNALPPMAPAGMTLAEAPPFRGFPLYDADLQTSSGFPADVVALAGGKIPDQGSVFLGAKGVMVLPHVAQPRLLPTEDFKDFKMPEVRGANHWHQFVDAILGKDKTQANFDYAGPLTEAVLLGSVATRFPKTTLEWNAARLKFTSEKAANQYVRRQYRKGWTVSGL